MLDTLDSKHYRLFTLYIVLLLVVITIAHLCNIGGIWSRQASVVPDPWRFYLSAISVVSFFSILWQLYKLTEEDDEDDESRRPHVPRE